MVFAFGPGQVVSLPLGSASHLSVCTECFFDWFLEVISVSWGSNYKLVPQIFASINNSGKPILFEPQRPTHRNEF